MIRIKQGVSLLGMNTQILLAIIVADRIWSAHNDNLVITSVSDGKHSEASLHYVGAAVDLRRWGVSRIDEKLSALSEALGPDFDVILEENHFHIEYQPKKGAT